MDENRPRKRITERDLMQAAADISSAKNYLMDSQNRFERLEKKFDGNFTRIFLILENDTKTGTSGIVQRVRDLEKWKADIDYVMANLRGQAMAYGAVGSVILGALGTFVWWLVKSILIK